MYCRSLALINDFSVPFETIGFQRIQNELGCPWLLAWRINVLNTKKPEPAVGSGL